MLFGMMSGVGRGMGVLDGVIDHRRGMGSFWGEFWASQWSLCCVVVRNCMQRSSCRIRRSNFLEVRTKAIHNDGLLGKRKIEHF